jgi:hypothetical protein
MRAVWDWAQVEAVAENPARPPVLAAVVPLLAAGYQYQAR